MPTKSKTTNLNTLVELLTNANIKVTIDDLTNTENTVNYKLISTDALTVITNNLIELNKASETTSLREELVIDSNSVISDNEVDLIVKVVD